MPSKNYNCYAEDSVLRTQAEWNTPRKKKKKRFNNNAADRSPKEAQRFHPVGSGGMGKLC